MPGRRELTELEKQADERLAAGDPIQAVALLGEAERAAVERDDGVALCGLLGDKAVALRRLGNVEGAIDTYRRAIGYCTAADDPLNLTRWLTNLAGLLAEHDRVPEAAAVLDELGDAAGRCEDRSVAASGEGTIGIVLRRQERFAEAVGHFAAAEKDSADPAIRALWSQNGLSARLGWADSLEAEDRPAEAAEVLEQALADVASVEDEELLRVCAGAAARLAVLYERSGAPDRSEAAVRKARDLFVRLGDDQRVAEFDALLGASPPLTLGQSGAAYADELAAALADDCVEDALTARVNLAGALLLEDDERAFDEFELALDEVKQRGDRRRELILLLNFAVPLLERGETQRAVKVADRGVELARPGGGERLVLALLLRARVRRDGAGDAAEALQSALDGIWELQKLGAGAAAILETPGAAELVGRAAQIALDAGDVETAATALRLLGVEVPAASPTFLDLDELRGLSRPELDGPLAAWRATPRGRQLPLPSAGVLAGLALLPGWGEAATRLAHAAGVGDPAGASAGGPAGAVRAAELAAAGEVAYDSARSVVDELALDDDDAELLALQLVVDRGGSDETVTALRLLAETTRDDGLAGRIYRLLGLLAHGRPELQLRFAQEGLVRLAGDAHEPLRADLLNETAQSLVMLGRLEEGLDRANEARELAVEHGLERLAALAGGNVGLALMNLGRLEEARSTLIGVASEYERLGDAQAAHATRFNLDAIRMKLGEVGEDVFSGESDDPDEVLAKAVIVAESGDTFRAIKLFERAFELIEPAAAVPFAGEPYARSDFANVLLAAGRIQAAARQLELAGELFDRRGDPVAALEMDVRAATLLYDEPERALASARRAVARAEQIGGAPGQAATLGVLGEVLLHTARFADAVDAFEQSLALHWIPVLVPSLAQALIGAGRPAEALELCEESEPPDPTTAARQHAASAEAHAALGSPGYALARVSDAYAIASLMPPDRATLDIAGSYGAMLAESGRSRQGVDVIEAALKDAQALGIDASERSLLIELGIASVALGDLENAATVLGDVVEQLRRFGDDRGLARACLALGHAAAAQWRLAEALELYRDTERLAAETGDELLRTAALDAMGNAYADLGRPGRAVEYHRRAADGRLAAGARLQAMESRFHLADSLARVPDGRAAGASLDEAVALRDELGLPKRWSDEFVRARVQVARGDWAAAAVTFRSSIELLESERDEFLTPGELRRVRRLDGDAYGIAARAAVAAGDGETTLEFVEAGRARFLHALVERRAQRPEGVSEETWLDYEHATDELADLRVQRRARAAAFDPTLEESFAEVERRHAETVERVRSAQSVTPAAKRRTRRFAELVDELPIGCAAVALDVARDGLEVVCAGRSAEGARWAEARLEPTFTDEALARLLETDDPASTCGELGARVWPTAVGLLPKGTTRLLLLPSSGLNVLPLHAAVLPGGTRACDRFSITYAPSIGLAQRAAARAAQPTRPVLGQAVPPTADLPFTAAEAAEVAEAHDGELVRLERANATVEEVRRLLDECDVFHFCGHGAFEPFDPLESSLACADGSLTARSILAGPALRARLVVLSACESGRVDAHDRLDDFVGLPGTFVAAGAAEVVATMWRVDDLAASIFVDRFFETWAGGRAAAIDALAAAQRLLRHELSVADVQERLRTWADGSDDDRIREAAAAWESRTDVDARPFARATYWAPFHLLGGP